MTDHNHHDDGHENGDHAATVWVGPSDADPLVYHAATLVLRVRLAVPVLRHIPAVRRAVRWALGVKLGSRAMVVRYEDDPDAGGDA